MDRIGILTFHHVVNWGSALQAVGVYKVLKRIYPKAVIEIIDYTPQTSFEYNNAHSYKADKWLNINYRRPIETFISKKNTCIDFIKKNTVFSEKSLISNDIKLFEKFIKSQNYDAVFVGSDQVFQLGPNSHLGNYIAAPQAPNAYFLPFEARFAKIGFAVTANPYHNQLLGNLNLSELRDTLNDFKFIFYRDYATESALNDIGVEKSKVEFLPDPTLMFDFDLICNDFPVIKSEKPIAGVAIGNSEYANIAMQSCIDLGYNVINLLGGNLNHSSAIKMSKKITLEGFVNLHKSFDAVITDRFHGSIITMMTSQCPLLGIEEAMKYPDRNSKIRDLYSRLNLSRCLWRSDDRSDLKNRISETICNTSISRYDILEGIYRLRSMGFKNLDKLNG